MSTALPAAELEPLRNPSLIARFPHLAEAMSPAAMTRRLQAALFDGGPFRVGACDRPRAEVDGSVCTLQYELTIHEHAAPGRRVLVLAAMHGDEATVGAQALRELSELASVWKRVDSAPLTWSAAIPDLDAVCSVFPVSAALPQLVHLLVPDRLAATMQDALGDRTVRVASHELVTFRRTRGCVLRIRIDQPGARTVYAKVGYAAYGRAAADALRELRAAVPATALRLPEVIERDDNLQMTLLAELPGSRPQLRTRADQAAGAAARCAAVLHTSRVQSAAARTLQDESARACTAIDGVAHHAPALGARLRGALDAALARAGAQPQHRVFCHGDLTPSQLVLQDGAPGILDFDKCCTAEPALDLGRCIAYLRFALSKLGDERGDAPVQHFLREYEAAGGTVPPAARLRAYETVALVRMAARSWLQLKPHRLRLACELIARD